MNPVEIGATVATVISVLLTVRRSLWQYPTGMVATGLFFVLFWQAQLYASACLQVLFLGLQIYGWWFWLYGEKGGRPPIRSWPPLRTLTVCVIATVGGASAGTALGQLTDARLPLADSLILGLSLGAQFLLDRKVIEHWGVWALVNVLSIFVYASQGLTLTASLYVALLLNTGWGWMVWRKEFQQQDSVA
jgi:nicotinamide mononucleotide transporter